MADLATMAAIASIVGTGVGLAGSAISAKGTIAAGKAEQQVANYQAAQAEVKGKEERAAAQRDAMQYKRQMQLALSKLQNNAAASGFAATDEGTMDIAEEIAKYGTLQQQIAQYGGKSRQKGYQAQAQGLRLSGQAARQGAGYGATGTILAGAGNAIGGFGRFAADYMKPDDYSGRYSEQPVGYF